MKEKISIQRSSNVNEVVMEIMVAKQEILTGGSADSEPAFLDGLVMELKEGRIAPEDALAKMRSIIGSRQDYH